MFAAPVARVPKHLKVGTTTTASLFKGGRCCEPARTEEITAKSFGVATVFVGSERQPALFIDRAKKSRSPGGSGWWARALGAGNQTWLQQCMACRRGLQQGCFAEQHQRRSQPWLWCCAGRQERVEAERFGAPAPASLACKDAEALRRRSQQLGVCCALAPVSDSDRGTVTRCGRCRGRSCRVSRTSVTSQHKAYPGLPSEVAPYAVRYKDLQSQGFGDRPDPRRLRQAGL